MWKCVGNEEADVNFRRLFTFKIVGCWRVDNFQKKTRMRANYFCGILRQLSVRWNCDLPVRSLGRLGLNSSSNEKGNWDISICKARMKLRLLLWNQIEVMRALNREFSWSINSDWEKAISIPKARGAACRGLFTRSTASTFCKIWYFLVLMLVLKRVGEIYCRHAHFLACMDSSKQQAA